MREGGSTGSCRSPTPLRRTHQWRQWGWEGLVRGEGDLQGLRSCRSFTPLRRTQQWRLWGWEGCAHVDHFPVSDARSNGVCGVGKGLVRGEGDLQGPPRRTRLANRGLRDRNSPTCTLSQNGYDVCDPPTTLISRSTHSSC